MKLAGVMESVLAHPRKTAAALIALGSAFSIAMAWGFQLIGGYMPCQLCLAQRFPYYVGLPLGLLALLFAWKDDRNFFSALLLLMAAVVFIYGGGIGVYQAGAEWDWWLGPNDCGGPVSNVDSAANILSALKTTRIVSCSTASIRFLGLSFAGMNVFYSTGIATVALLGVFLRPKAR